MLFRLLSACSILLALWPAELRAQDKDIVDTAVVNGSISTLVAAIEAAGLAETLTGDGQYTIFAPTDEAFAALPDGTVENLLLPENKDQLVAILSYHVVPGRVTAEDVRGEGVTVSTVQGSDLPVGDGVLVDSATVVAADIEASNGVIHVIDRVLLPGDRVAFPPDDPTDDPGPSMQ